MTTDSKFRFNSEKPDFPETHLKTKKKVLIIHESKRKL